MKRRASKYCLFENNLSVEVNVCDRLFEDRRENDPVFCFFWYQDDFENVMNQILLKRKRQQCLAPETVNF